MKANGAIYEGDLTKQITHLISFRTEGAKYRAAKSWGLRIVSVEWLRDSLERGMILDETLYDPVLPPEERGKDAWDRTKPKRTSLGKRSREDSTGALNGCKRKLRRTASTKLNSQNDQIWGAIVGGGGTVLQVSRSGMWGATDETPKIPNEPPPRTEAEETLDPPTLPNTVEPQPVPKGFFSECRFYFHGFVKQKTQILCNHLLPQDAEISTTMGELVAPSSSPIRLFRVVPSSLPVSEQPELPPSDVQVTTVTEWWVERCLHHKKFMDPGEHVIGRPFPAFPIPEFKDLTVSTAAFSGIDLLHVTRAVELLGAKYSEDFTKRSTILLTKTTIGLRKDKLEAAREWKIPIVDASWLWDSIGAGTKLPLQKYRFRGQKRADSIPGMSERASTAKFEEGSKTGLARPGSRSETLSSNSTARPPRNVRLDNTAFISDKLAPPVKEEVDSQAREPLGQASNSTSDLSCKSEPLSEINPNSPSRTVSTAPAPSDHPNPRPPKEDISNAISDLLRKTKSTTPALHIDVPEARKRGRILGRAASNVSAASTPFSRATSVDSTATHGHPVEYPSHSDTSTAARKTANERIEEIMKAGKEDREEVGDEERPSTQLQYEDPESEAYKERVMARMFGEKEQKVRKKERLPTIADGIGGERPLRRRGRPPAGGLR